MRKKLTALLLACLLPRSLPQTRGGAALLAAARRRTCAAHGARAGHGRISVRPRLPHAGRSLSPALGRDTHVRRMPCGTARTASLVDISVLRLHAHPPFFAIF